MHVAHLGNVRIETFDLLGLRQRSQRDAVADLGLAAGEHRGTVCARDQVDLSGQRADLLDRASVRTLLVHKDHLADGLLLIAVQSVADERHPLLVVAVLLGKCLADLRDIGFAGELVVGEDDLLHLLGRADLIEGCIQLFRDLIVDVVMLFLAALSDDLIEELDDLLVDLVGLVDRLDHLRFRDLVGAGLDHDDLLAG